MAVVLRTSIEPIERHEVPSEYDRERVRAFIAETAASGGAELANAQSIFRALCDALCVPPPSLKNPSADNAYVFEEDVKDEDAARRIDIYKRGAFVFEAKQGVSAGSACPVPLLSVAKQKPGHSKTVRGAGIRGTVDWLDAMRAGRHQAGNYAVNVTRRGDHRPPQRGRRTPRHQDS